MAMPVTPKVLLVVLGILAPVTALAAPPQRTLEKDVIELLAGREIAGKADLTVFHEGVAYRFSTPENKAAFEKDPAKHEVADGGACGRMGPLAGLGDARRFAVHAGRVYFFASDGCRAAFLKEPAAYLEFADEMPFGSNAQVLAGRAALDRAVAWAGGTEKLRAVTAFRAWAERTEKQGDTLWRVTNETIVAFPRQYYQKEAWNDSWFSTATGPGGGVMDSRDGPARIAETRARAFERSMARWPIVILKAHADGSPKADCPGLVVVGDGEGVHDGTPVEFVKVWLNGAASRLTISKATGQPLAIAFRGRDASMRVGDVVRTFAATATVDGLTLPTAYTVTFDGKAHAAAASTLDGFVVNPDVPAGLFAVPAWPSGE